MNNYVNPRNRKPFIIRLLQLTKHLVRRQTVWCARTSIWRPCKVSGARAQASGAAQKASGVPAKRLSQMTEHLSPQPKHLARR
jgi:hypothetical protein